MPYGAEGPLRADSGQVCKGLPLAIVSVGSLLFVREKNPTEWKRIHDQLGWELAHNPGLDDVRNTLYLSFIYLPTYLKSCFLYCSLFPEDYILHRKLLIRLWIAEGFIEERGHSSTLEEVAEGYLNELVHRNMLQPAECNSFGRIRSCKMHDIVRELAIDLSQKESFGLAYEYGNHGILDTNTRRLVVSKCSNDILPHLQLPRLRSCIIFHKAMPSSRILDSVAVNSKYIVVLELCGLTIEEVPSAVGDLFNLRDSKVKILPKSIEKLSNLLTLDIFNSVIQELPHGIVKLKNLRHLLVERIVDRSHRSFICRHGMRIQKGLSKLTSLQTLNTIEAREDSIKELGELKQLRSLRISNQKETHCALFCRSILKMQLLNQLHITMSDKDQILQLNELKTPPLNLQKLILRGRLAEVTFQSPLFQKGGKKLCGLYLVWSCLPEDPLPSISGLDNLTELHLTEAFVGKILTFNKGWFPNLKSLKLRDLPSLSKLKIKKGAMESLHILQLVNLRKLKGVPAGLEFLTSLQSLKFSPYH
ncbi:hypothetical protein VPH35_018636 [Triticum aestivum]|uniref:NB-ARC domain-containing protein n=1 Tax=Triticum turgidum subsp. durum TaxID=4567 RepID=A0A9R1NIB1_TRITD|nr:unnamed protein product [Triticum turgidum subsp. durum]